MKQRDLMYPWFAETYNADIVFWRLGCRWSELQKSNPVVNHSFPLIVSIVN